MKVLKGKKIKTEIVGWKCPNCGEVSPSCWVREDGKPICSYCGKPLANSKEELEKMETIKKVVDAYICPECGEAIPDIPENWSPHKSINGNKLVVCPHDGNILTGELPLIHHGSTENRFEIEQTTDYFYIIHKACKEKKHRGICEVYALWIDDEYRIILNVRCPDCGTVDALKTHLPDPSRFFITSKLESRIGTDDLNPNLRE